MNRALFTICYTVWVLFCNAQASTRFEVKYQPLKTDAIYIAGSFNNWEPGNEKYRLQYDGTVYSLVISLPRGTYEYKYTRGNWKKVECTINGDNIPNRKITINAEMTIQDSIKEWQDSFTHNGKKSTASKNVFIVDTAFYIPQLKRTRRVWVYLPQGYERQLQKRYPVLYMQDGQNLFDDATAFAGEWAVDDFMDSTKLRKCIIVGVDNGGEKRMNEYNPYDHKRFGKGEGKAYLTFLVNTLKPFIDGHYRTIPDKSSTYIAGSSMGGLISFYAMLYYPNVFGTAGILSPSFWIVNDKVYKEVETYGKKINGNIYLYMGGQEEAQMINDLNKMERTLTTYTKANVKSYVNNNAGHNEAAWRLAFPKFYRWLTTKN